MKPTQSINQIFCWVPFLIIGAVATAGVRRDGVDDSVHVNFGAQSEFDPVGKLTIDGDTCSGTVIDSQWVLTASHCIQDTNVSILTFDVGGMTYSVMERITHPNWVNDNLTEGWDIGLIRLSAPVLNVTPATRYTGSSEVSEIATLVGFGRKGVGSTGSENSTEGTKRAGHNVIDLTGGSVVIPSIGQLTDRTLLLDFDNPDSAGDSSWGSSDPLALEYLIAKGDSGGGLFIDVGGLPRLAGVHAAVYHGPISSPDGNANSDYGDLMGSTRVSLFNDWIDDHLLSIYWNSAISGSFVSGANWLDGSAPTAGETAVFNVDGAYTVTLTANVSNRRIRVRDGDVTLDLGGFEYSLAASAENPSLIVGQSHNDSATLVVTNGTLSSHDAVIAWRSDTGQDTAGQVIVTGAGTNWTLADSLYLGGSATTPGGAATLRVENGAAVQVGGTLKIWTSDTLDLDGGDLQTVGFDLAGGTVTGTGNLTLTGPGVWTSGSISGSGLLAILPSGSLDLAGTASQTVTDRTLDNAGTITWSGSENFSLSGGAVLNNLVNGTFDAQNDETFFSGTFNNAGMFRKSSGAGVTQISAQINNTGSVEVQSGTLRLLDDGLHSGTFAVSPGATLDFGGGTHDLTGSTFANSGEVTIATAIAGDVILDGFVNWISGTMLGGGTTTIPLGGTLDISSSVAMVLSSGRTITNQSSILWTGTGVVIASGAVFNAPGATFDSQNDASWAGSGTFDNEGVFLKSAGTGTTTIGAQFNNSGSVDVQSGTLSLLGGGSQDGTFNIAPGATLRFGGGTHNLTGTSFTNSGEVIIAADTGGDVTLDGFVNWISGIMLGGGTTTIPLGATLEISGISSKILSSGRTLSNEGTTTWTGTGTVSAAGSVFSNMPLATFDAQNDAFWSGGTFNNAGTLLKSAGTGTTTIGAQFNNSGSVDVQTGVLQFATGLTQTTGELFLNGGNVNVAGSGLDVQGGMVTGSGSIFGVVNNSGGAVSPGASSGLLQFSSDYSQGTSGEFNVDIGGVARGSEFDALDVGGHATLDGNLDATIVNPFVPSHGQTFLVMTFASRTGVFSAVTDSGLPDMLVMAPFYTATDLTLSVELLGDANGNGKVEAGDYTLWANSFGMAEPSYDDGDFNRNGRVEAGDYTLWVNQFGSLVMGPASSPAAVPEPSTLVLTGLGLLLLLICRRRLASGR